MAGHHHTATGANAATTTTYAAIVEVIRRLQTIGYCLDLDTSVQHTRDHISPLFHHLLSLFLAEIIHHELRSPPYTHDGRPVDLFKLFCYVRDRGGYDSVTTSKTWALVAEELGFGARAASAVKLLYSKNLFPMERWLTLVLSKKARSCKVVDEEIKECETPRELKTKVLWTPTKGRQQTLREVEENGEMEESGDEAVALEGPPVGRGMEKRKSAELAEMVGWVKRVARRPGHPSTATKVRGQSEGVEKEVKQFAQALLAREVVIGCCSSNGSSLQQKRQRPHPSIYEDFVGADHERYRKVRCSERILSRHLNGRLEGELMNSDFLRSCNSRGFSNDLQEEWVFVDPYPQSRARVPPWMGKKVSSDSDNLRWLGTRIWPLNAEKKPLTERAPVGIGREDNCLCEHRGSIECVRFHVAEKRLQLKCEISSAFHHWKFNKMGEEVALSWKEEEEQKFKSIVRQSQFSPEKSFWEQLYLGFPYKSRQNLVSYYFNVFLLRRRGYQNRVTPANIDSDDEEPEFGFLSKTFGQNAVEVPNCKTILCAQNEQCVELDEFADIDYQSILDNI